MVEQTLVVTGGCGFIGSALVRHLMNKTPHKIINVDVMTYAAHPATNAAWKDSNRYTHEQTDIANIEAMKRVLDLHKPPVQMCLNQPTRCNHLRCRILVVLPQQYPREQSADQEQLVWQILKPCQGKRIESPLCDLNQRQLNHHRQKLPEYRLHPCLT